MLTTVPMTKSTNELLDLCRIAVSFDPSSVRHIAIDEAQNSITWQIALARLLLSCPRIDTCTVRANIFTDHFAHYVHKALATLPIKALLYTPARYNDIQLALLPLLNYLPQLEDLTFHFDVETMTPAAKVILHKPAEFFRQIIPFLGPGLLCRLRTIRVEEPTQLPLLVGLLQSELVTCIVTKLNLHCYIDDVAEDILVARQQVSSMVLMLSMLCARLSCPFASLASLATMN